MYITNSPLGGWGASPMKYDAVILADGTFPSHPLPLSILQEAKFLVCCDNAGRKLIEEFSRIPDAIVGDGDTISEEFKQKYSGIYHQIAEQEYNDLTKATRFTIEALGKSNPRIAYIGATGKREDHTIGNISLISYYKRTFGIIPEMITDYGIFSAHSGESHIQTFPHQQVSIFNLTCKSLSSQGLKWDAYACKELWQDTLNEALGNSITLNGDGEYLVYITHKAP